MNTTDTLPSPVPTRHSRFSPADLWRMFKERWLTGLLCGAVAAAAVLFFQPEQPPLYSTEVYLLFSLKKDRVLNIPEVVDTTLQTAGELNTHIEQLKSKTFFEYLLVSFTPEETKRILAPYLDPEHPDQPAPTLASVIRPNTSVFVRKGTTILGISVTNRDPENAALIANRYARKYIDYNLDRASTGTNSAIVFLRNQAEDMRRQVSQTENGLQEYRAQHNLASLGENQNVVTQKLASVGAALVHAQMDQIELQTVLANIAMFQKEGRPLVELPAILSFGQVAQSRATLETLRGQRNLLAERYLARHPRMKDNEIQINEAQRQLDEGIARAVADYRTRHDVAARYEEQLRGEMRATETQAREYDRISVEYKLMEQDAQTKRAAYTRIIDRLNEASISSQMEDVNIRIFDRAWVAAAPTEDTMLLTLLLAGGACLACTLLVPICIGFCDTRVKTTEQVELALGQKLLGGLPRIRKSSAPERAQAFLQDKHQPVTESYRGLYGEIEVVSTLAYPKSLLITSSVPNEGKTFVACNLASVFASHGRRTLLVDCDLRRPTLHEYLEVSGQRGWVQWLQEPAALRPALPDNIVNLAPRLDLLPAGAVPSNCTQLLEQFAHVDIQKQLLAAYDLVIFDTPPATIFPDALLLARSCHELIYVCQFGSVRLNTVRRSLTHLASSGVRVLGVILNLLPAAGADLGFHGYGSKSMKYYKAYANRTPAP